MIRPFVNRWYNGAGSGHSDITLAQFQEKSKLPTMKGMTND